VSQKLFDCIAGAKLKDGEFKDFAKAIEHSILTTGCWCYETLKKKASEFGKSNPNETYLRITLGQNNGESPGVPYVMEIWPPGHYSPVHNHAGANAIIRVLRGTISVSLYSHLGAPEPFGTENFSKGDVTWISPTLNQTHKLKNNGTKTCITLQCYMYAKGDHEHYEYFDYVEDGTGLIKQYEPDSDMDFVKFKNLMKKEWSKVSWFNR
jgi:quercetin dioxygenase-like cupin family protein